MRWNVCRICLAGNAETNLTNTELLDIYEKITSNQWIRDQRPDTICYICLSLLKRCYKLREMSQKSELIFAQFFGLDFELTKETVPLLTKRKLHQLMVSPMQTFTLDSTSDDGVEIQFKEETSFEVIEIKPEITEELYCLEQKNNKDMVHNITHQNDDGEAFPSIKDDERHSDTLEESKTLAEPLFMKVTKTMNEIAEENNGLNDSQMSVNNKSICFILRFNPSIKNNTTQKKGKSEFPLIRANSSETPLTCARCGQSFTEEYFLKSHMKTHREKIICTVCDRKFSNKRYLERHKRVHEKSYPCKHCPKSFDHLEQLQTHLRIHSNKKPYLCNICDKDFAQLSNLQQHRRIHTGETPYSCDLCGKKFKQQSNLLQHNRTHTKEKPYCCDICSKAFAQHSNLKQHIQVSHCGEKLAGKK